MKDDYERWTCKSGTCGCSASYGMDSTACQPSRPTPPSPGGTFIGECQPRFCKYTSCYYENPRCWPWGCCHYYMYEDEDCKEYLYYSHISNNACNYGDSFEDAPCIKEVRITGVGVQRSYKIFCSKGSCLEGTTVWNFYCPEGRFRGASCLSKDVCPCAGDAGSSCNCNACGQCGGTVQCDGSCTGATPSLPANYGQSCGNCGTIGCSGACENQGDCAPNTIQCIGSRYHLCLGSCSWTPAGTDSDGDDVDVQCGDSLCDNNRNFVDSNRQCSVGETTCINNRYQTCNKCAWQNSGTDSDGDGVDVQCQDATCDNTPGVCDTLVSGKCIAKTSNEAECTDSMDNDCDRVTDCSDNDCAGSISGSIQNSDNDNVDGARIDVIQGVTVEHQVYTDNLGNYQTVGPVLCGEYNIVASASTYISSTKIDIILAPKESKTVDFTGNDALVIGTTCEDDCTYAEDNTIHKECNNINGCIFYDATAMQVCNLAQPGWIRDYNNIDTECPDGNCVIECAEGTPQPKVTIKAEVTCELENMLKLTKIVTYKGKLVKLNIVTCG